MLLLWKGSGFTISRNKNLSDCIIQKKDKLYSKQKPRKSTRISHKGSRFGKKATQWLLPEKKEISTEFEVQIWKKKISAKRNDL